MLAAAAAASQPACPAPTTIMSYAFCKQHKDTLKLRLEVRALTETQKRGDKKQLFYILNFYRAVLISMDSSSFMEFDCNFNHRLRLCGYD
jgi:hypothetical protein